MRRFSRHALRLDFPESESLPADSQVLRDTSRAGATLIEVLMAIMVMGIGVMTVSTLFVISLRNSIQATHLTNATILRMNAEAMIDTLPFLIFHPDGDTLDTHEDENYVVDPLGFTKVAELNAAMANTFGNDGTDPDTMPPVMRRYSGGFDFSPTLAADLVSLPDSWIVQLEGFQVGYDPTKRTYVDMPADLDLSQIPINEDVIPNGLLDDPPFGPPFGEDFNGDGVLNTIVSRVYLFDTTGRRSEVREILDISGQRIRWDEYDQDGSGSFEAFEAEDRNQNGIQDTNALPVGFTPALVRIVSKDQRYTWILTVRNIAGVASTTVVVFVNRPFDLQSERIYGLQTPGNAFLKDADEVTLDYTDDPKPYLRKGSYVFDAENGHWYRVANFTEDDANQRVTLQLGRRVVESSNSAILMEGIVDIYPIELKP